MKTEHIQPPRAIRLPTHERIYQTLKDDIFSFRLLPGDRLTELELAARLNTSRTPVREALGRLQQEGFVTVFYKRGWQVNRFDFDQFEALYDVRLVLELAAVERLCALDNLTDILQPLTNRWFETDLSQYPDGATLCTWDDDFHRQLVALAGNREMSRIYNDLIERLRIVRKIDFTRADRLEATWLEHAEILRAILNKDEKTAKTALKSHILASKSAIRQITLHTFHNARANTSPRAVSPPPAGI